MSKGNRDHGLPNDCAPIDKPVVTQACNVVCGNEGCQCEKTFGIEVPLYSDELDTCWGYYRGCAACGWASAMEVNKEQIYLFPYDKLN